MSPNTDQQSSEAEPSARHVAIIMDGNGRWAQRRGLPRNEGHRQGVENLRRIVRAARDLGIRCLTLYAFSCENWQRPKQEIDALMVLLERFLNSQSNELHRNSVRLRTIGRIDAFPPAIAEQIRRLTDETAHYSEWTLVLALNYGSRTEVLDAMQAWRAAVEAGEAAADDLDWRRFSGYLYTAGLPDPDLIIRTSGETRVSNFLLLQGAYAELYFSPKLWPDFSAEDFAEAIASYQKRQRRFGKTGEQVHPGRAAALGA